MVLCFFVKSTGLVKQEQCQGILKHLISDFLLVVTKCSDSHTE